MFDYIENLRLKPGHVRQRIAFGAAAGLTVVVFTGWLAVLASSHAFSLSSSTFAASDVNSAVAKTQSGFSNLLGAAAAYGSATSSGSGIVVETEASTTASKPPATSIPF